MRFPAWLAILALAACGHAAHAANEDVAPEVDGDGSSCEKPIVVHAGSDQAATTWEYQWLRAHYPGHQGVGQALTGNQGRMYDELRFKDAEGKETFVCFDITHTFGT